MVTIRFKNLRGFLNIAIIPVIVVGIGLIILVLSQSNISALSKGPRSKVKPTPTPTPISSGSCSTSAGNAQVLSPNGGETFQTGSAATIKWCVNKISEYNQTSSSIWLASRSTQSDGTFIYQNVLQIASKVLMQPGENSLNWNIPATVLNGYNYVVLVNINCCNPNYDYSDQTFTIKTIESSGTPTPSSTLCSNSTGNVQVKLPNGEEAYKTGSTAAIKWCVNKISEYNQAYSNIWLTQRSTQSDGTYVYRNELQIASSVLMQAGENSLNWNIPATVLNGYNYVILVTINSFNPNYDYSDNTFSITQ